MPKSRLGSNCCGAEVLTRQRQVIFAAADVQRGKNVGARSSGTDMSNLSAIDFGADLGDQMWF